MQIVLTADNGRPKIVQFDNGFRIGVMGGGMIVARDNVGHVVPNSRPITASEWHRKGLRPADIRQAEHYAGTL